MKAITEEMRQGDKVTGTVTTIWQGSVKIELCPWSDEGAALIAEIARRCNAHEQMLSALKDVHPFIQSDRLRSRIGGVIVDASEA